MTTNNPLWHSIVFSGLGVLIVCTLGIGMAMAQASKVDEEVSPPITSAPAEIPQGDDEIDYKNAKPIPMPSLPDPTSSENLPVPPSTGERKERSGNAPGCTGTGKKTPEVVIPPNPS